jgi:hypothetical protein
MVNPDAELDRRLREGLRAAGNLWEPDQDQAFREFQRRRQQRGTSVADRALAAVLNWFPLLAVERVSVAAPPPLTVASQIANFGKLPSQRNDRMALLGFLP